MGSSTSKDSKCAILITFSKATFSSDEVVWGKININVKKSIMAPTLNLRFKGREITSFEEKVKVHSPEGEKSEVQTFKGKRIVCDQSYPINSWKIGLAKGGYVLPFTFQLPPNIPGSFYYDSNKASASIRYKFYAELISEEGEKYRDKSVVHISEKFSHENVEEIARFHTYKLVSCCCLNRGICSLEVVSNQNTYNPTQIAIIEVKANLAGSKLSIKKIYCRLFFCLRIKSNDGRTCYRTGTLLKTNSTVNIQKEGLLSDCAVKINLNLPAAKSQLEKRYSTKGELIDFVYKIEIKASLNGYFMCRSEMPLILHELFIVADPVILASAPQAPPDWNPQELEIFNIDYNTGHQLAPSAPELFEIS